MGLTKNTATALLALNGRWGSRNGPQRDTVRLSETGAEGISARVLWGDSGSEDEEEAPDMAREFAYGLAKRAYGFQREPVGRA